MFSVSHIGAEDEHGWIVQKYGGTSVGSASRMNQIVGIIKENLNHSHIAVVCSAMSPTEKKKGTTSMLLAALNGVNDRTEYKGFVDKIRKYHVDEATMALDSNFQLKKEALDYIHSNCNKLSEFLDALDIISEISPLSKDVVVSFGERLSCKLLSLVLQKNDIPSVYIGLESLIDRPMKSQLPLLNQQFYDKTSKKMAELMFDKITDAGYPKIKVVPVVTGYFGFVPGSLLSAIGRGYSDLSAALLSAGILAEELQIWKEVDGIFTADPRKIKNATLINEISPDEAAELTYYGSEVIHPFTMDQAIRNAIPIRIKNTFNPLGSGTVIVPSGSPSSPIVHKQGPTAVTIKDNIILINVRSNLKSSAHGFLSKIFHILDSHRVTVDLISISQINVTLAIPEDVELDLSKVILELEILGQTTVAHKQCILSVVGKQMRRNIGIACQMFNSLAQSNTNIEMISQGASEINISCVIHDIDAIKALQATHELIRQ